MWSSLWHENLYGKPKYSKKACPSVLLYPPEIPHGLTWDETCTGIITSVYVLKPGANLILQRSYMNV
jgi:hypothetical protein